MKRRNFLHVVPSEPLTQKEEDYIKGAMLVLHKDVRHFAELGFLFGLFSALSAFLGTVLLSRLSAVSSLAFFGGALMLSWKCRRLRSHQ